MSWPRSPRAYAVPRALPLGTAEARRLQGRSARSAHRMPPSVQMRPAPSASHPFPASLARLDDVLQQWKQFSAPWSPTSLPPCCWAVRSQPVSPSPSWTPTCPDSPVQRPACTLQRPLALCSPPPSLSAPQSPPPSLSSLSRPSHLTAPAAGQRFCLRLCYRAGPGLWLGRRCRTGSGQVGRRLCNRR